ncbi:hypothetical protein H8356DRAFT_1022667 [Neocallimastix lanati (nom. inval.)]|nr:hypothetical protein H8356DRAFT_1022667 [Neocallimastix sp. JGI-2020a]
MSTSNIRKSSSNRVFNQNQDGFTQRQKEIINSCKRSKEKKNKKEKREGVHAREIKALVEGTSKIKNNRNDTFITQQGGKIYQSDIFAKNIYGRQSYQSTLLLQKKNEMDIVQKDLDEKRAEFVKKMKDFRLKKEELKLKQKQIKERVAKFEKFLKDNDAKVYRANIKIQNEKKLKNQKILELNELKDLRRKILTKSQNIQYLLKKYYIYEEYLQSVLNALPQNYLDVSEPHINNIIMRHTTLIETQQELKNRVIFNQEELENIHLRYVAERKKKNNMILVYNSQLDNLQKKYEIVKSNSAYLEQHYEEQNRLNNERMRILGEAKLAINNLYERAESRNKQNSRYTPPKVVINPLGKKTKSNAGTLNKISGLLQSSQSQHNPMNINDLLKNDNISESLPKTYNSNIDDRSIDNRWDTSSFKTSEGNIDFTYTNEIKNRSNHESTINSDHQNNVNIHPSNNNDTNNFENYTYNMKSLYEKLLVIQARVIDLQNVKQKVEETIQQEKKKQEIKK